MAYGRARMTTEAYKILEEMKELSLEGYVAAPQLAMIYLGLDKTEEALDQLEQGFEERSLWMIYLGQDPVYDCVRSHPRFARLIERLRFSCFAEAGKAARATV